MVKRKNNQRQNGPYDANKRPRRDDSDGIMGASKVEPRVDPTYGQRSALPGLDEWSVEQEYMFEDGGTGDDPEAMTAEQALRYLKAVRKEAAQIPNLLVAPKLGPSLPTDEPDRSMYEDGTGDFRGYYKDGAYTAAPVSPPSPNTSARDENVTTKEKDPQEVYFSSIITRFLALRSKLHAPVPESAILALDLNHTAIVDSTVRTIRQWLWRLKRTDPVPAQIASMCRSHALRLLGLIGQGQGGLLKAGKEIDERTGRWLWALLARLPDRGEMTSEEVGVVRDLGKVGVKVSLGWKKGGGEMVRALAEAEGGGNEEGEQGEENEEGEYVGEDGEQDGENVAGDVAGDVDGEDAAVNPDEIPLDEEEDFEAAKARLLARISGGGGEEEATEEHVVRQEPPIEAPRHEEAEDGELDEGEIDEEEEERPTKHTRATVDMILTVAGEVYGQRDLLEFREVWA